MERQLPPTKSDDSFTPKGTGNGKTVSVEQNNSAPGNQKTNNPDEHHTTMIGINVSGSFMGRGSSTYGIAFDDNFNVVIVQSTAAGGGTPSAGIGITVSRTNANSVYDLQGLTFETGGSAAIINVEKAYGLDSKGNPTYKGTNVTVGISTPYPEGHGEISNSTLYVPCPKSTPGTGGVDPYVVFSNNYIKYETKK